MQWTMPHRVLQIVAALIGLAAVTSFVLGIINAPLRSARLPGEKLGGVAGSATAIDAPDATPLSNERIEGPAPPTAEEIAKAEAKKAEAEAGNTDADDDAAPTVNVPAPPLVRSIPPATGNTADQTLGGPPAPDEPPH
ncbi:hypothetical protein LJR225_003501 [Phenylobacterium sp. LjRoot225]|uniref:hypothetical protein n=1 Tax=Phenylobacterium sp. LjRoot225 TaxID=3342285 RepID=UPI003ECCEED1